MSSKQNAYLTEWLTATGWNQSSVLHFRYQDAFALADHQLKTGKMVRAVRIRPVSVSDDTVYSAERESKVAHHAGR